MSLQSCSSPRIPFISLPTPAEGRALSGTGDGQHGTVIHGLFTVCVYRFALRKNTS
jgi:hypothetical protein